MSVVFDKTNDSNNGDWITADSPTSTTKMMPSFPFSVSLWVRFEASVSGTETIWFYGDKGATDKYLVLEARLVASVTKLRARMENASGDGPTTANSVAVTNDVWHLVTVVATKDGTQVTLTLYLDAEIAKTGSSDVVTSNEGDYDRFAIGRFAGSSGSANPGSFLAEQAAIWNTERTSGNHGTMYADDLNGEDVRRPPTIITPNPDIGYWVLAGHRRHILRLNDSQIFENEGDLHNDGSIADQPDMQLGSGSGEPVWSVKTPAVLYNDTATTGIPARKRKVPTARHSPHFYWFAKPELYEPWTTAGKEGLHPVWDDPNMNVMARVPYDPGTSDKYMPPEYNANNYHPTSYLTQITKRVADWFEYQNFTNETGSGGGGQYEGCVFIQALGSQNDNGTLGRDKQETSPAGAGLGIPLEQHPQDEVGDGPSHPWAVWFRANGEGLLKEYSEEFWPLLKAEFDRRGLAYPKRLHWDFETSASAGNVLSGGTDENFTKQLGDSRSGAEAIVGTQTLDDIWDKEGNNAWNTYDPTKTAYDPSDVNLDWRLWYLGWQRMLRQDALNTAIMTPAANEFAQMRWSNYNDFVADNAAYPHYFYHPKDEVVTPQSSIPADFAAPVLYPNTNWNRLKTEGFGETAQSVQWAIWDRAINAMVNTSGPIPLSPWVSNVGYTADPNPSGTTFPYTTTRADLRWLLRRCWQRGANEFIVWVEPNAADGDLDATYDECKFLVNTVKCMMNTKGSRTCRMGRTYRICR